MNKNHIEILLYIQLEDYKKYSIQLHLYL